MKSSRNKRLFFCSTLCLTVIGIWTCGDRKPSAPDAPTWVVGRVKAAAGGSVRLENGPLVTVPASGFARDVDLSIRAVEPKLVPLQPNGSVRVGSTFEIEAMAVAATGVQSAEDSALPLKPLSLHLPYDPAQLPGAFAEEELVAVFWDGAGWVAVATTVDAQRHVVLAAPSHLSLWSVEGRNSRIAAVLEISDASTLHAGDPISLRISALSLEDGESADVELIVTARFRDEGTGSVQVRQGHLLLTEAPEQAGHRLDLFPGPGTLGERLLTVEEQDEASGDGFFDLVLESNEVHERVESIAFSARVGSGLSKVETDRANMIFPLPPPPTADLAITRFALVDAESQPLNPEALEDGQEVILAVGYANFGGLPVFDARIELRINGRLAQEADLSIPVGSRGQHNFRLRLSKGEQRLTTLIRSVGQLADSTPADNQMAVTLAASAAIHQLSGRVVNDARDWPQWCGVDPEWRRPGQGRRGGGWTFRLPRPAQRRLHPFPQSCRLRVSADSGRDQRQ